MEISMIYIFLVCGIVTIALGIALIFLSRRTKESILHQGREFEIHHSWGSRFGITQVTFPSSALLKAKISFKDNLRRDVIFRIKETKVHKRNMPYEPIIVEKRGKSDNLLFKIKSRCNKLF